MDRTKELKLTREEAHAIEAIIDRIGLSRTLLGIGDICVEKADHLEHTWQDETSARVWSRGCTLVNRAGHAIERELDL